MRQRCRAAKQRQHQRQKIQLRRTGVCRESLETSGSGRAAARRCPSVELRIDNRRGRAIVGSDLRRILAPQHNLAVFQRAEEIERTQRSGLLLAVWQTLDVADGKEIRLARPGAVRQVR